MSFSITNKNRIIFGLIALCFLLNSALAFSQTDSLPKVKSKPEFLDVYFSAGPSVFPVFGISQKDFKKIVPSSKLMNGDLMEVDINNYNNYPYDKTSEGGNYESVSATSMAAQAGVTLRFKDDEIKNVDGPWLKIGVNYFSNYTLLNSGVYKTKTSSHDSIYIVNSIPVQRDSVNSRSLAYSYNCKSINLEATLLYKFNDKGIFSLFGGPGIMVGANYNGTANVITKQYYGISDYLILAPGSRTFYSGERREEKQKEEFKYGPNFSFGLFFACGIDLRLGNTFAVLKRSHAFAEFKPMFRGNGVKGGGFQQSVLYVADFGVRYELK